MVLAVLMLMPSMAWADIVIGGSVYGGGKQGAVGTANSLATEVKAGTPVDADNATTATVVTINGGTLNNVYGGGEMGDSKGQTNVVLKGGSISGSVYGGARMADIDGFAHVLIDGANAVNDLVVDSIFGGNDVSGTIGGKALVESTEGQTKKIYVTNLFGGGNGDYDYASNIVDGNEQNPYAGKLKPEIADVEIALRSGCYFQVFGGGNAATVTNSTKISLNNSTTTLVDGSGTTLAYQFERVFGGNNKEPMAIRPTWDLQKALVNNLYSGGNAGAMTYYDADNKYGGILLAIESADMTVNNVYGGCRMADVDPGNLKGSTADGNTINAETIGGYDFPQLYAARVLIKGGKINNVYGGNDISGNVYYGSQVEILSSINNDVYGGGNGSYAYTDNANLKDDPIYGDYYYEVSGSTSLESAQALNIHRPNAEKVLVHVSGKSESQPTYIGGSLYCGGNSATLRKITGDLVGASATLTIGPNVIANQMFLGSNGANMVAKATENDVLQIYKNNPVGYDGSKGRFTKMNLTEHDTFEEYMKGVEVAIIPTVGFDPNYTEQNYYSSKIGSLYCGGNVGSMSASGYFELSFLQKMIVFDKLVGGCNNANLLASDYNAYHEGGLTTHNDTKVKMNVEGLQLKPMTLTRNIDGSFIFNENRDAETNLLVGGNIYGGCYESGYINGGVEINLGQNAIHTDISDDDITNIRDNVFSTALSIFGGGYGENTEIWGNTTINISGDGNIAKVFGGGQEGLVGRTKGTEGPASLFNEPLSGNATINLTAGNVGKIYGGGFEGLVTGNTIVKLDGGTVYDAIAGACNANINGYAQMLMGTNDGQTIVAHNVYGGNDFGGAILGAQENSGNGQAKVTSNTYVLYKKGIVAGDIFGGACGSYDYSIAPYSTKVSDGFTYPMFSDVPMAITSGDIVANSYVDIQTSSDETDKVTGNIYGGGCGFLNAKKNGAQLAIVDMKQTYVLLRANSNDNSIASNILAGGYFSKVTNTRLDAYSGKVGYDINSDGKIDANDASGMLFGGTFGATTADAATPHMDPVISYNSSNTEVNLFNGLNSKNMSVFGAGSYAGATTTNVNIYGGNLGDIYGGSFNEGVCETTNVLIPGATNNVTHVASNATVNRIFGGSYGMDINLPCDVLTSNVTHSSVTAYVADGIYGGNNNARATKITNVNINVPARTSVNGQYISVCGGGNGANSVAGYTHVNLNNGAQVRNVYGGGRDGEVFGSYDDKVKAPTYYASNVYAHWSFTTSVDDETWGKKNAVNVEPNTNIYVNQGATAQNIYGAGYGSEATVAGNTYVKLNGGTVTEDIFGGGYSGNVNNQLASDLGTGNNVPANQSGNVYTFVDIYGGTVRNVYGGGFEGSVGLSDNVNITNDIPAESRVRMGDKDGTTFLAGIPTVERSLFGGGYRGAVIGTSKVRMYNGYLGYRYNAEGTDIADAQDDQLHFNEKYEENLNLDTDEENLKLLRENGNLFGGGFGEGATVDESDVVLYGGFIRNSMYGGGEIAAIGRGSVNGDGITADVKKAGLAKVNMYGGLVSANVFGGGRGYWIDDTGNNKYGEHSYSDGYVFGKTEVYVHRGFVGTDHAVGNGDGNVFGGGNIGYVYSATGTKNGADGYYYEGVNLTEDCKVVIAPVAQVTADAGVTINSKEFAKGDFVELEDLNTLINTSPAWSSLDNLGITVANAVFAGGNVSRGSDRMYANAKTVYGNATASITDIFSKDFITIGDDGIGGLYGDGNLTFVDGYRELNITNYGTDYYNLNNELTVEQYYHDLTDRERAYFELLYSQKEPTAHKYNYYEAKEPHNFKPSDDAEVITYRRGQKITTETYIAMAGKKDIHDEDEQSHWKLGYDEYKVDSKIAEAEWALMDPIEQSKWDLHGFCTLYAGRMINTIQRADFCGVFGSRIVLRGAQDRVPSVVDYTDYTINRVKELSLNQVEKLAQNHGNYFGIYGVVNYLGALTSDVDFYEGVRETEAKESTYLPASPGEKYSEWKHSNLNNRKRNNGKSANEVALASGVWLEILDESGEDLPKVDGVKQKVYGPITGVVQLDLLNVATGEGGGYVYAKNVHGVRSNTDLKQVTLTAANHGAISQKQFTYAEAVAADKMQSSGNFVNSLKRIVDDCYPGSGQYVGASASPAHYWYIRGEYYVYDQYISAYTGAAQAYAETVSIPLTITAEAQGRLQLESINQNRFAYWTPEQYDELSSNQKNSDGSIQVNGISYKLNDPISYYDYNRITSAAEKALFTESTYVCTIPCKVGDKEYSVGDVVLPGDAVLNNNNLICVTNVTIGGTTYTKGVTPISVDNYNNLTDSQKECFDMVKNCFNMSNALSHENGFLLTFNWDNPDVWNGYYHRITDVTGSDIIRKSSTVDKTDYVLSPTFKLKGDASHVFGQRNYEKDDLIDKNTYDTEAPVIASGVSIPTQAVFQKAYAAKNDCKFTIDGRDYIFVKGAPISESVYNSFGDNKKYFDEAYLVTETYQVSETKVFLNGELIDKSEYNSLDATYGTTVAANLRSCLSSAYVCTQKGLWGGQVFEGGKSYEATKYGNLSDEERRNFGYNYDALDLFSEDFDPNGVSNGLYQGNVNNHSNGGVEIAAENQIPYCEIQSIDYTAIFDGTVRPIKETVTVNRNGVETDVNELHPGDILINTEFEKLLNEQAKYSAIVIKASDEKDTYYVVKKGFQVGDIWYSPGKLIDGNIYDNITSEYSDKRDFVYTITKDNLSSDLKELWPTDNGEVTYYICKSEYDNVEGGTIISSTAFGQLVNEQKNFSIEGRIPTQTSTLFVARETDIRDLSKDKIVTASYWYEYIESDDAGNYEAIREKHIVNVHIHFESGIPTVGELLAPSTVLPGTAVGLNNPEVSKGAYEILGGGWEMFASEEDAVSHKNGMPYIKNATPMYWYQDGYYVAYYAKSYLGKTYSNYVPFSVANYHNIDDVMNSQHIEYEYDAEGNIINQHTVNDYMFINDAVKAGKRNPKIYIKDATHNDKTELDQMAMLFDKTTNANAASNGLLNVLDCNHLEFILQTDVHPYNGWASIGAEGDCFSGNFHGNGHTITGMNNSLFNYLCGDVYNTGVTGSFNGAGIAETGSGYVENCWVATTGSPTGRAVFNNPSDNTEGRIQLVNSYYPESNSFTSASMIQGNATMMPVSAFVNGEVAYNLNGFYLQKRYYDNISSQTTGFPYKYWKLNDGDLMIDQLVGTQTTKVLNADLIDGYYPVTIKGNNTVPVVNNYVEDFIYSNIDFIYSDGTIPTQRNIRYRNGNYYPIYPDDYIFFGQNLSFNTSHDVTPVAAVKDVSTDSEDDNTKIFNKETSGNRVFRAPAYYQNSTMSTAHYNKDAMFQASYTTPSTSIWGAQTVNANKGMTAIDFTGYGDATWDNGWNGGIFNKRVLDYEGLNSFNTNGITRNLLIYAPEVLNDVLDYNSTEPGYSEDNPTYRTVAKVSNEPKWHVVNKTSDGYVAKTDHFLVDKQEFNAPIEYSFAADKRMWYQRTPELYATLDKKGWEGISLPFTVDLVTTPKKGEITHFYGDSNKGHEYWLRGYAGATYEKVHDDDANKDIEVSVVLMNRPSADNLADAQTKTVGNTFLWDYYYSKRDGIDGIDANTDDYQQNYYNAVRNYEGYAHQQAGVPYIVGFPGSDYYEFDLSGTFVPQNSGTTTPKQLAAQVITFASAEGDSINISDVEMAQAVSVEGQAEENGATVKKPSGYSFKPNYLATNLAENSYVMNAAGDAFEMKASAVGVPFRPYFEVTAATPASPAPARTKALASKLVIGNSDADTDNPGSAMADGTIRIWSENNTILIENNSSAAAMLTVYTSGGQLIKHVNVPSKGREVVKVNGRGIYLVGNTKVIVK